MAHTFYPSIWEAGAGRSQGVRRQPGLQRVLGHPGSPGEILSQKTDIIAGIFRRTRTYK